MIMHYLSLDFSFRNKGDICSSWHFCICSCLQYQSTRKQIVATLISVNYSLVFQKRSAVSVVFVEEDNVLTSSHAAQIVFLFYPPARLLGALWPSLWNLPSVPAAILVGAKPLLPSISGCKIGLSNKRIKSWRCWKLFCTQHLNLESCPLLWLRGWKQIATLLKGISSAQQPPTTRAGTWTSLVTQRAKCIHENPEQTEDTTNATNVYYKEGTT